MKRPKRFLVILVALIVQPLLVQADPLTTMNEVGKAILACWKPPAGAKNSSVTLRFSFKKDGSLIGSPRSTATDVDGDENIRQQFFAAAIDAVEQCTPVEFSRDLAQKIAGLVFTMKFATADRNSGVTPRPTVRGASILCRRAKARCPGSIE
jgi:hypothetical protein